MTPSTRPVPSRSSDRSGISARARPERSSRWLPAILIAGATLAVAARYLGSERRIAGAWGYSLDDSWIYATMARNLATGHGFAFNPDQPVAGATGPLYTFVLAFFYLLFREVIWSAKIFGLLCQVGSALSIHAAVRSLIPERSGLALLSGLLVGTAPALVWGALSGMEIPFYLLLVSAGILLYARGHGTAAALVWSLGVWVRPDGLYLTALAIVFGPARDLWKRLLVSTAVLLPFLAFNHAVGGHWMPQTVQAKAHFGLQLAARTGNIIREWMALWGIPYRPTDDLEEPVLLLALLAAGAAATARRRPLLTAYLIGFPLALSLFHEHSGSHKRYILYVIPFGITLAMLGLNAIRRRFPRGQGSRLVMVLGAACLIWQLAFAAKGAELHGWNVQNINAMQRSIGVFAERVTKPGDRVATNDIGAIGYFSRRPVVDLMGLITPQEPLPRMLSKYRPELLVVFVDWFYRDALIDNRTKYFVFVDAERTYKYTVIGAVELRHNTICARDQMLAFRRTRLEDPTPDPIWMEVR